MGSLHGAAARRQSQQAVGLRAVLGGHLGEDGLSPMRAASGLGAATVSDPGDLDASSVGPPAGRAAAPREAAGGQSWQEQTDQQDEGLQQAVLQEQTGRQEIGERDNDLQLWARNPSNAKRLTKLLLQPCDNLDAYEQILEDNSPFLNARHIAIALTALPRIVERQAAASVGAAGAAARGRSSRSVAARRRDDMNDVDALTARARRVKLQSLVSQLAGSFLRHLPEYGPRDLAGAVWALGRLGLQPPGGELWLSSVLGASAGHLGQFDACQLSCMLWGVAVLGTDPGPAWLAEAIGHALAAVQSGAATDQGTALMLWSIAKITASSREVPPLSALDGAEGGDDDLEPGVEAAEGAELISGASSSQLLSSAWLNAYLHAAAPRLTSLEPRYRAMMLCALAKLCYRPRDSVMEVLLSGCLPPHSRSTQQQTEPSVLGSSNSLSGGEGLSGRLSPQGFCNLLWALGSLEYRPSPEWLGQGMAEAVELLPNMRGQEVALSLWGLTSLKVSATSARDLCIVCAATLQAARPNSLCPVCPPPGRAVSPLAASL